MALLSPTQETIGSDIQGAYNLYRGLAAGTPRGYVSAGTTAAKLGGQIGQQTGLLSQGTAGQIGGLAADVANLANIYTGIQRGGVAGYGGAAINAAALYGRIGTQGLPGIMGAGNLPGAGPVGQIAGPLAAAYSTYQFVKNWQSGATGQEALMGAETGASIGTAILPGVGTLIGAGIGAAAGAISSAFGGGRTSNEALMDRSIDTELANAKDPQRAAILNQMNPSSAFQMIQGYMNAHDNSPGHSEQIEQVFGKNGVANMMGQMLPAINQAISQNPALKNATPQQLYSQVVAPWLKSKGATIDPNARDVRGNPEGQNLIDAIQAFIGDWQSGKATSSTRLGINGETLNMPQFGAGPPPSPQQQQTQAQALQIYQSQVGQAATSLGNILNPGATSQGQMSQMSQLGGTGTYLDQSMSWLSTLGQQAW